MPDKLFECEYCNKVFKANCTLTRHKNTAQFCLQLQGKMIEKEFTCNDCGYKTLLKNNLLRHEKTCFSKKENERKHMRDLEDENLILKTKSKILEELIKTSNHTTNNTTNNNTTNNNITFNITLDHSMKVLAPYEEFQQFLPECFNRYFTYEEYLKGITHGLIPITINKVIPHDEQKRLICYEGSKSDFHQKRNGKIEIDSQAVAFIHDILPILKPKFKEYCDRDLINSEGDDERRKNTKKRIQAYKNLEDVSSKEHKQFVKSLSESCILSKSNLRMYNKNERLYGPPPLKITDYFKKKYVDKHVSDYYEIKNNIPELLKAEFNIQRYERGIDGFIEAAINVFRHDDKIWLVSFESDPSNIWIKIKGKIYNEDHIRKSVISDLTASFNRLNHELNEIYEKTHTKDEADELYNKLSLVLKSYPESDERKMVVDSIIKALCVSDQDVADSVGILANLSKNEISS